MFFTDSYYLTEKPISNVQETNDEKKIIQSIR